MDHGLQPTLPMARVNSFYYYLSIVTRLLIFLVESDIIEAFFFRRDWGTPSSRTYRPGRN